MADVPRCASLSPNGLVCEARKNRYVGVDWEITEAQSILASAAIVEDRLFFDPIGGPRPEE